VATLGQAGSEAVLLLRFSAELAPDTSIIEAYVMLDRARTVDADPVWIGIHAERIEDAWDPRAVAWANQPRLGDTRSSSTWVAPAGGSLVRVDVRALVRRWRTHDPRDQGIGIVAENTSPTGIAFALASEELPPTDGEVRTKGPAAVGEATAPAGLPRLELYVK
jgi:hypothetical protein